MALAVVSRLTLQRGRTWLIWALLSLSQCGYAASTCGFTPLVLAPADKQFARYLGQGRRVAVEVHNERVGTDAEVFPEPPMRISVLATGEACSVTDPGVWTRAGLYLSASEEVLLAYEYSGSSVWLAFYDTRSCARLAEVSVPEGAQAFKDCLLPQLGR